MAEILVYSEQASVAFQLLSKARELGAASVATLGEAAASDDYTAYGAKNVFVGAAPQLAEMNADIYADALAQILSASGASIVLVGSTKRGKELAGRLAQRLECGAVIDATGLEMKEGRLQVQHYGLGGNTVATDVITSGRQVIAVMPGTFEASKQSTPGITSHVELKLREPRVKVIERKAKAAAATNIENAETLIVAGKGFAKAEDLALANTLAQALKGEVGCTRTLSADFHWLGEERTVGISGKKCKPRLLISIGVSGQIQHTVGILGSRLIVAINKDKAAPIFKIVDYGIIGDLYELVPKLTKKIGKV